MEKPYEVIKYNSGIELIIQKEPIPLLYIMENGEFVTNRYVTYPEFTREEHAFTVENGYDGKEIMYYNPSEEQVNLLKNRLEKIESLPEHVPNLFKVLNEIEKDFTDRRGYRQEWESYPVSDHEYLKMNWYAEIMREVAVENMEEAVNKIPFIIKNSWLKYNGLKKAWQETDEKIQKEIIEAWQIIIKNSYIQKTAM